MYPWWKRMTLTVSQNDTLQNQLRPFAQFSDTVMTVKMILPEEYMRLYKIIKCLS